MGVQDGERSAQAQFVAMYQRRVFALCSALAGSDAEDVAQEALLHALSHLARFDPHGPARLSTFVLRIARNLCIDRARSSRVQTTTTDTDGLVDSSRPDARLAAEEDAERVRRAVLALPEDQRAAVALRNWGELEYDEIAAIERVPVGTIRSRLSRARDALRRALSPVEEVCHAG